MNMTYKAPPVTSGIFITLTRKSTLFTFILLTCSSTSFNVEGGNKILIGDKVSPAKIACFEVAFIFRPLSSRTIITYFEVRLAVTSRWENKYR